MGSLFVLNRLCSAVRTKGCTYVTGARPSEDIRVSVFVCRGLAPRRCVHLLNITVCVYNQMSIQATLPSDLWTRVSAMATDKKPRVSEAYSFQEFPLKKLGLKKPEFVTKSVFSIPELKHTYAYASTWIPTTPRPSKTIREYRWRSSWSSM